MRSSFISLLALALFFCLFTQPLSIYNLVMMMMVTGDARRFVIRFCSRCCCCKFNCCWLLLLLLLMFVHNNNQVFDDIIVVVVVDGNIYANDPDTRGFFFSLIFFSENQIEILVIEIEWLKFREIRESSFFTSFLLKILVQNLKK